MESDPITRLTNQMLRSNGWNTVLLRAGSKAAAFRNWQEEEMPLHRQDWHMRRARFEIGLTLENAVVVDKDMASRKAHAWLQHYRIHRSPMEVATNEGVHFFFRRGPPDLTTKIRHLGLPLDILTGRDRYVVAPGSVINGVRRELRKGKYILPADQLPEFPAGVVVPKEKPAVNGVVRATRAKSGKVLFPERYCMAVESVQGEHGSKGLLRVCWVMRNAGRTLDDTLLFLREKWNPVVPRPPWSDEELVRAATRVFSK